MSKEGDHHYVPQFHLSQWEGPDFMLRQWGRVPFNDKLVCKQVTTAQTAYVPGLYSLEHVLPDVEQQIETKVFGKIESEASPVLEKLIDNGPNALSVEERYWWTKYLVASLLRVPHVIKTLKDAADKEATAELLKDPDEYAAIKGSAPEDTLLDWAQKNNPATMANIGMKVLADMLDDERPIDRIIHLTWLVRDVSSATHRLMIGDNPYFRVGDLFKLGTLVSMPLSPTHVFFATDTVNILRKINNASAKEIVRASNISQLSNAKKFAYGDAEREFIERHLCKAGSDSAV